MILRAICPQNPVTAFLVHKVSSGGMPTQTIKRQSERWVRAQTKSCFSFQSIKSRREIERRKRGRKRESIAIVCLSIRLSILFTLASSHCSTHRRFRGGSSSSESEGCGVGSRTGWVLVSSSSFRSGLPDLFEGFSPSKAATLNDNGSI